MGRNFYSVCHLCGVQLMHFRRKEGELMQRFANDHAAHEGKTEIYSDYIKEPPSNYADVFDRYHADVTTAATEGRKPAKTRKNAPKEEA